MGEEVTNAPLPPGKDPLTPGKNTTEFLLTSAGMFLTALFGLLATFNVLVLTPEQKMSVYEFVGISWTALPIAYAFARTHLKASAIKSEGSPLADIMASAAASMAARDADRK